MENNCRYFIVYIKSLHHPGNPAYALLIPSDQLPRFFELDKIEDLNYFIFIDDVIRENLNQVFPDFEIHGAYSVKLTRDADLNLEDEFAGDIAKKLKSN